MSGLYCPVCATEFRPEIERCSDCGGPLERQLEASEPGAVAPPPEEPLLPPGTYLPFAETTDSEALDAFAVRLSQAGIPFVVVADVASRAHGFGLKVRIRTEDRYSAWALKGDDLPVVRGTANDLLTCPACGTARIAGSIECPECTLVLGGDSEEPNTEPCCRYCGRRLEGTEPACTYCRRKSPFA
jgi:hypothetical protein